MTYLMNPEEIYNAEYNFFKEEITGGYSQMLIL